VGSRFSKVVAAPGSHDDTLRAGPDIGDASDGFRGVLGPAHPKATMPAAESRAGGTETGLISTSGASLEMHFGTLPWRRLMGRCVASDSSLLSVHSRQQESPLSVIGWVGSRPQGPNGRLGFNMH